MSKYPDLHIYAPDFFYRNWWQNKSVIRFFIVNNSANDVDKLIIETMGTSILGIGMKREIHSQVVSVRKESTELISIQPPFVYEDKIKMIIKHPDGRILGRSDGQNGWIFKTSPDSSSEWFVIPDQYKSVNEKEAFFLPQVEGEFQVRCLVEDFAGNKSHGEESKLIVNNANLVWMAASLPELKEGEYRLTLHFKRNGEERTYTRRLTVLGDSTHVTPPDPKPDPKPVDHPKPKVDDLVITAVDELELGLNETKTLAVKLSNHGAVAFQGLTLHSNSDGKSIKGLPSSPLDVPGNTTVTHDFKIEPVEYGATALDIAVTVPGTPPAEKHKEKRTKVYVTPPRREGLDAVAKYKAHWRKTAGEPEFIYSYNIDLSSKTIDVSSWVVSFHLPKGARLNENVLTDNKEWVSLDHDKSTDEFIYLQSVPGNVIHAGAHVSLDIQIVYPSEQKQYEELKGVTLSKHE